MPLLFMVVRAVKRVITRPAIGCCKSCGYSLTGDVSGTCPECGTGTPRLRGSDVPSLFALAAASTRGRSWHLCRSDVLVAFWPAPCGFTIAVLIRYPPAHRRPHEALHSDSGDGVGTGPCFVRRHIPAARSKAQCRRHRQNRYAKPHEVSCVRGDILSEPRS